MRQSVVFKLRGALSRRCGGGMDGCRGDPDSADGWQACLRLVNGDWLFDSHGAGAGNSDGGVRAISPTSRSATVLAPGAWTPISATEGSPGP